MFLLDRVMMLSGNLYGIHQNCYAIVLHEEKRLVFIDCGLDQVDLKIIQITLNRWKMDDYRISDVFITHCHFDHAGNASYYESLGAKVHAGWADTNSLLTGDERTLTYCYDRAFPVCSRVDSVFDQDRFSLSDIISLTAYETPGHSAGSICYLLKLPEYSVLFTGDFIQSGDSSEDVHIGIKVDRTYDYDTYLSSIRKMLSIQADYILTGHYKPDLTNSKYLINHAYRELLVNRTKYQNR